MVVARGRTGRKPTPQERGSAARERRRQLGPPTWSGAFSRGLLAATALLLFSVLILHAKVGSAIFLFVFALLLYVPATYYFDLWLYRRRVAKEREGKR
jgi:Flp pilus assembly protein TadB